MAIWTKPLSRVATAVELPQAVKRHFGLDTDRPCVVLDEVNEFTWPGFDLRPIPHPDAPLYRRRRHRSCVLADAARPHSRLAGMDQCRCGSFEWTPPRTELISSVRTQDGTRVRT
jgi:hypothetical protein